MLETDGDKILEKREMWRRREGHETPTKDNSQKETEHHHMEFQGGGRKLFHWYLDKRVKEKKRERGELWQTIQRG